MMESRKKPACRAPVQRSKRARGDGTTVAGRDGADGVSERTSLTVLQGAHDALADENEGLRAENQRLQDRLSVLDDRIAALTDELRRAKEQGPPPFCVDFGILDFSRLASDFRLADGCPSLCRTPVPRIRPLYGFPSAQSVCWGTRLHKTDHTATLPDTLLLKILHAAVATPKVFTLNRVCKRWHALLGSSSNWDAITSVDTTRLLPYAVQPVSDIIPATKRLVTLRLEPTATWTPVLSSAAISRACADLVSLSCGKVDHHVLSLVATRCPRLQTIEFTGDLFGGDLGTEYTEGISTLFRHCPDLHTVRLTSCKLHYDDLWSLFARAFTTESDVHADTTEAEEEPLDLVLQPADSTADGADEPNAAMQLSYPSPLRVLKIRHSVVRGRGGQFRRMLGANCADLESLTWHASEDDPWTADELAALFRTCVRLRAIDLKMPIVDWPNGCTVDTRVLRAFCVHNCTSISDEFIVRLVNTCPLLEILSVPCCPNLSDVAGVAIARGAMSLASLDLSHNCRFGEETVAALCERSGRLANLCVRDCYRIETSAACCEFLRRLRAQHVSVVH